MAFAEDINTVDVAINGEAIESDVSPFIENGRTLVPVRAVSEYLQYSVEWFDAEQKVEIKSDTDTLTLYIGNTEYLKNGEKRTMDVPARVKEDRTVVPIRLIAEEFGCEVEWDGELNLVNIIKYNIVEAKSPNDIIANAGSYTKIILTEPEYNLSELDETDTYDLYVQKEETNDGYEYVINYASHLVIEAPEGVTSCIVTQSRYANVLNFFACSDVVIKNVTMGHKIEKGYCVGGVINTVFCSGINIDKCNLYGCGTYGITALNTAEINVENTQIYECSYGLLDISDSNDIRFDNCIFRDTEGFSMFCFNKCSDVCIENSIIKSNKCMEGEDLISASDCININFENCEFKDNSYSEICDDNTVNLIDCGL